jgi:hypothetical protein
MSPSIIMSSPAEIIWSVTPAGGLVKSGHFDTIASHALCDRASRTSATWRSSSSPQGRIETRSSSDCDSNRIETTA